MPANAPIGTLKDLSARPMTGEPFRPLRLKLPPWLLACAALTLWHGLLTLLWIWLAP